MPNSLRAKDKINLQITMVGLARVHRRYLAGMKHSLVLGDSLERDYRWINELERILIGSNYLTREEIHRIHAEIDPLWKPEYDLPENGGH